MEYFGEAGAVPAGTRGLLIALPVWDDTMPASGTFPLTMVRPQAA